MNKNNFYKLKVIKRCCVNTQLNSNWYFNCPANSNLPPPPHHHHYHRCTPPPTLQLLLDSNCNLIQVTGWSVYDYWYNLVACVTYQLYRPLLHSDCPHHFKSQSATHNNSFRFSESWSIIVKELIAIWFKWTASSCTFQEKFTSSVVKLTKGLYIMQNLAH